MLKFLIILSLIIASMAFSSHPRAPRTFKRKFNENCSNCLQIYHLLDDPSPCDCLRPKGSRLNGVRAVRKGINNLKSGKFYSSI